MIIGFFYKLLNLYELVIILRVLFIWTIPEYKLSKNQFINFIFKITDYPLERINKKFPVNFGNFDFSPIILFVFIELIKYILVIITRGV